MDSRVRFKVLNRLAQSDTDTAKKAIAREVEMAAVVLANETEYSRLEDSLSVLKVIGFRASDVAVSAIVAFISEIEGRALTYSEELMTVAMLKDYRTAGTLLTRAIGTLEVFRYRQTAQVLHAFLTMSRHTDERVRKAAVSGLETLCRYDMDVFYGNQEHGGIGAAPQEVILDELGRMGEASLRDNLPSVLKVLAGLLSPEMEGSTWSSSAVMLRRSATPADGGISSIRARSIELLKRIFPMASEVKSRLHIVGVLTTATRTAGVRSDDERREMYIRDSKDVLAFFTHLVMTSDLEVVQKIEHNSYWIFHHAVDNEIAAAARQVEAAITANAEYQIFRTLIGFEGIFGEWPEVKAREFDPGKIDELRKQLAREFVANIEEDNYREWCARILKYAEVRSDDLATFPIFYYFLERLAIDKPDVALRLISEESEGLVRFLIPLFRGLWGSTHKDALRALLINWIARGLYLYPATKMFLSNSHVDLELLQIIFNKSVETEDLLAIREMVSVALSNVSNEDMKLIENLMLPALEVLTKNRDASWIFDSWFRKEIEGVFKRLGESGIDLVLLNLSALPKIDHQAERILALIAKRRPEKVLRFFIDRLKSESRHVENNDTRFEAIPFELPEVKIPLSTIPGVAVKAVRQEYDGDYGLFIYRGARLLKIVFPDFPESFEAELSNLVEDGAEANIEFVLAILRAYDGPTAIQGICKQIVKTVAPDSPMLNDVALALESTGVVTGEFGMAEAYERKAAEIAEWLNDPNEKVRDFAKRYFEDLQAMSSAERKRAQEQIELRKFSYGES